MKQPRHCKPESRINGPNIYRKTRCHCIQETILSKQTNLSLKNCNRLFKEWHTNYPEIEGAAVSIHKTFPYQKLIFNTPLQAISGRFNKGRDVTIVFIYNSRRHHLSKNLLTTLFQQLSEPVILTGDFIS